MQPGYRNLIFYRKMCLAGNEKWDGTEEQNHKSITTLEEKEN